jgi:hypothetical protein
VYDVLTCELPPFRMSPGILHMSSLRCVVRCFARSERHYELLTGEERTEPQRSFGKAGYCQRSTKIVSYVQGRVSHGRRALGRARVGYAHARGDRFKDAVRKARHSPGTTGLQQDMASPTRHSEKSSGHIEYRSTPAYSSRLHSQRSSAAVVLIGCVTHSIRHERG